MKRYWLWEAVLETTCRDSRAVETQTVRIASYSGDAVAVLAQIANGFALEAARGQHTSVEALTQDGRVVVLNEVSN